MSEDLRRVARALVMQAIEELQELEIEVPRSLYRAAEALSYANKIIEPVVRPPGQSREESQ